MDGDTIAYLALFCLGGAIALFVMATALIFKAKKYWASSLAFIGSLFALLAWFLMLAFAIADDSGNATLSESVPYMITMGCLALVGIVLSLTGLICLCARFRSTHKRRLELEQILSILQNPQRPS